MLRRSLWCLALGCGMLGLAAVLADLARTIFA